MAFVNKRPIFQGVLYDINGNDVGTTQSGINNGYRLDTMAMITDQSGNTVNIDSSGNLSVTGVLSLNDPDMVSIDFTQNSISADTDYMFIDLDNASGDYKHVGSTGVKFNAVYGHFEKENPNSEWDINVGVILRIDGTDADIAYIETISLNTDNAIDFKMDIERRFNPNPMDLTVSANVLTKTAASDIQLNDATINTGTSLNDVGGNATTPAPGDIIIRVVKLSGGAGNVRFSYSAVYEAQ